MKVITFGVFDILHEGHKNLFLRSKALGDYLIVAAQTDEYVIVNKPGTILVDKYSERKRKILETHVVDEVISYEQIDETIKEVDFDILVVGGDQTNPHFVKAIEWCKEHKKQIIRVPRTEGICSSWLRLHLNEIVHMTPENENEIDLKLLFKMPWSIYPYSNYKQYGLKNENFNVYVLNGVAFTTYGKALQFCSETEEKTFYELVSKFIIEHKINMVSGPTSSLNLLKEYVSPKLFETGFICEMKQDEPGTLEISRASSDDEFESIAALLNEANAEANAYYYKPDELYDMLRTRYLDKYGRTLFYRNKNEYIATVSTYAENDEYAVIGGLAVKKEYRLRGIGSSIFRTLINELKNENKKVYLFAYNKDILPFYLKTTEQTFEFSKMYL